MKDCDQYKVSVQAAIEQEIFAEAKFRKYIQLAAKTAGPIAHMGDGNGGYLISIVMEELKKAGLYQHVGPSKGYKKKKIPSWLRTEVYERDEYSCVKCGIRRDLTLDHIIPEIKGGPTRLANLQTMCKSCNSKKGWRDA